MKKKIALIVACWQEADVISDMVHYNLMTIDYTEFDIFIGVYPNDIDTVKNAQEAENKYENVHCVINEKAGPTNKADNLNSIYRYINAYEKKTGETFTIIVMHDPEDVIHYLSFKLFNYLIPKAPMVQIPIFPIETEITNFINWTYSDEFAESHTKDMIVREMVNGFVPSAGVGTGFDRDVLAKMAETKNGVPFGTATFTEDYSTALQLHLLQESEKWTKKPLFTMHYIERVQMCRPWYYFGKRILKKTSTRVSTRSLFPITYGAAVKQRARWTLGIVFQEWQNTGWPGRLTTLLFILHDRKAFIAHFCGGFAYVIFLYWLVIYIYAHFYPYTITLEYFLSQSPWAWVLIYTAFFMMLNRILQRTIATTRIYGLLPGITSVFRIFAGNLINMHAFGKAFFQFFNTKKAPQKAKWAKTKNRFPMKDQLTPFRQRLGDILITKKIITPTELIVALKEQSEKKEKLGVLLMRKNIISEDDLLAALSKQYNLESRRIKAADILTPDQIPGLSKTTYQWLVKNHYRPIAISHHDKILSIAISNPEEDLEKAQQLMNLIAPYKVKFFLSQWGSPSAPTL